MLFLKYKTRNLVNAAIIGTLYVVLTLVQSTLFPGSTSQAIQFRASEALMMLTAFSPSAIVGLTIGCAVSNIFGGMALDILFGSFATFLSGMLIYQTRNIRWKNFPILSLFFPAFCNGVIIGLELQFYFIGGFNWISFLTQASLVAIGEFAVSTVLGIPFYYGIQKNIYKNLK